jgi:hypothetical protein
VKTADRPNYVSSPAAAGPWFGWARYKNSIEESNYFVQKRTKARLRVNPKGTAADGGGIYRHTLVYAQWRDDMRHSNLYRFNLRTGRRAPLPAPVNTPRRETDPTLSGRYLLFERRRTTGGPAIESRVVVSKIMLYDRRTGALRVLARARDGYSDGGGQVVYGGQVNGAFAVWERATATDHITGANVVRLNIRRDIKTKLVRPKGFLQRSPSVSPDGTVYFVRQSRDRAQQTIEQIVKQPVGAQAEVLYTSPSHQYIWDLYVDDRAKSRHVYFNRYDDRSNNTGIYKLIDPIPRS